MSECSKAWLDTMELSLFYLELLADFVIYCYLHRFRIMFLGDTQPYIHRFRTEVTGRHRTKMPNSCTQGARKPGHSYP